MTRSPRHVDGSLALKLDFGHAENASKRRAERVLRLAPGLDKYKLLEHRRRQAQIRARHLLDLMEEN